jgi:hypothetical protein
MLLGSWTPSAVSDAALSVCMDMPRAATNASRPGGKGSPHTRTHHTLEQAHTFSFTHTRGLCDVAPTTHVPAYRLALRKSSLVSVCGAAGA